ncbi:MAG: extracellular solute-binding protein family 5, partial [Clostridia bacterium]|nr:extracellular solute-binding protein family 5 [Clostridia bacterium]
MKKSLALVLALVFVLSMALTACGPKEEAAAPEPVAEPKVLRMAASEPPNLDPQLGTDTVSIMVDNAILEGLIRVYAGEVQPGMAEKWEISEDGLTYTFHLRDAVWSDGKKVTAQDFEYSFLRLLDPATASEYAFQGYYIVNGEEYNTGKMTDPAQVGVKALDEKTLEIKLHSPTKYFLALTGFLSFMPSRKDLVEQHKEAYAADADKAVYNGPFVLTDWQHDASMVLEKNPTYWNKDAIKLDKVELTIVVDNKTVVNMYEAGDIDLAALGKDFIDKYKAENKAIFYPNGAEWYFQFNVKGKSAETGKVLANANFRKAVAYAIDRQAFCDAILKNGSTPAQRYILPLLMGDKDKFAKEYPYEFYPATADSAKAKEYLDKALAELKMTIDQVPAIEYLTDDSDTARTHAEAVQDMLSKNLGIKMEVKQVQFKQRLELMQASDYDIVSAGWGPDYDDPMTFMDL